MATKPRASDKPVCDTTPSTEPTSAPSPRILSALERKAADIESVTLGFTPLESEARVHTGRSFFPVVDAVTALLGVLSTPPEDPALRRKWERMARTFDVLGDSDGGVDPDRFEVERFSAQIDEYRRMQRVADRLDRAARLCRDQALVTAESLARPTALALDLARTLARGEFGAQLVPVTDVLKARSAAARRALPKPASATATEDKPAPPKP